jgi:hypothetical protein
MKIVTCVEIVYGVIDRMKTFKTMELAMKYFNSIVPDDGSWSERVVGDNFAHAIDNEDSDYEIYMEVVEMEV